jgi:Lipid A 3-O-deacylase (PagL)
MKNACCFLFFLLGSFVYGQHLDDTNAIELNLLRGNILPHSPELYHLITGHPEGFMLSFSKKTHGKEAWQKLYNYPDYGGYFIYQDFKNEILGKNYAIGAHYNFYFLNRKLKFKIAQGIAMTTNPYDKVNNSKNRAFGSKYMGNTDFMLTFKQDNIIDRLGLEAGFFFTHYSSGRFKSPNSGLNTYGLNIGFNYNLEKTEPKVIDTSSVSIKYSEPVKFNLVFRSGFNESIVIGSGQKPFYHLGFYADKRINRKSALQVGTDFFITESIREYIKYRSIAYPDDHLDPNTDYKRIGLFIGHELFINRISLETQVGYYIYRPFESDKPIYDRLGMKYYWTPKIYSGIAVKTHGFLAEATEFSVGVRL